MEGSHSRALPAAESRAQVGRQPELTHINSENMSGHKTARRISGLDGRRGSVALKRSNLRQQESATDDKAGRGVEQKIARWTAGLLQSREPPTRSLLGWWRWLLRCCSHMETSSDWGSGSWQTSLRNENAGGWRAGRGDGALHSLLFWRLDLDKPHIDPDHCFADGLRPACTHWPISMVTISYIDADNYVSLPQPYVGASRFMRSCMTRRAPQLLHKVQQLGPR